MMYLYLSLYNIPGPIAIHTCASGLASAADKSILKCDRYLESYLFK